MAAFFDQVKRQMGQLYKETSYQRPERPKATKDQGVFTPVTPQAVAAAGGTEQQAAMAGTPAQKAPVLDKAVKPQDSLATQQRQTPAPAAPDQAAKTATEKVDRLQQLGSLGSRVQSLIEQRVTAQTQQTATQTVNEDALKTQFANDPTKLAAARAALQTYLTGGKTEDQLAQVAGAVGADRLAGGGLASYFTDGTAAVGAAAASNAAAAPTLGQLDLAGAGIDPAQLAQDLGVTPEALAAMSPTDLQSAVKAVEDRELSSVDALKAEAASASPNRRAQILADLQRLDATGQAAAEVAAKGLQDQIAQAGQVTFNGKSFAVEDLLKSDEISTTIKNAAASEQSLAELRKTEPALAQWITDNKSAIAAVAGEMGVAAEQFGKTQESAQALRDSYGDALKTLLPDGVPSNITSAQLGQLQQQLANDPLAKAVLASAGVRSVVESNPDLAATLRTSPVMLELAGSDDKFLTALRAEPAAAAKLAGKSADEIRQLMTAADSLKGNQGDLLATIAGVTVPSSAFATDMNPAQLANVAKLKAEYDKMPGSVTTDPNFAALVKSGVINDALDLKSLRQSPELLKGLIERKAANDNVKSVINNPATRTEDVTKLLFGTGSMESTIDLWRQANLTLRQGKASHSQAELDQAARVSALVGKFLDFNEDGRVDDGDEKGQNPEWAKRTPESAKKWLAKNYDSQFNPKKALDNQNVTPSVFEDVRAFMSGMKVGDGVDTWGANTQQKTANAKFWADVEAKRQVVAAAEEAKKTADAANAAAASEAAQKKLAALRAKYDAEIQKWKKRGVKDADRPDLVGSWVDYQNKHANELK
jgi:hypothetical protein